MNLDDFMAQLRAHPEYFQVIAQDGGPPSIVMSDPRTDQQVAQYSVPDVTGYRYSDGFQAQMPTGDGDRISVANPDKRPTVQELQEMWSRSQLPGAGVSFDQYMKETGAQVDASGRVDQTISKDWGFGGGSIWDAIVDLAPKALALYGGVTGLESLIGGGLGAAAEGAGAGASLLDPSLITSPVAPVSTGGVSLSEAIQQAAAQAGGAAGGGLAAGMGGVAPAIEAGIGATAGGSLGAAATGAALGSAAAAAGSGAETGAFDQYGSLNSPTGTGMPGTVQQVMGAGAASGTGAAASLLNKLLGTNLTDADTGLIGKLLATGLGGIGASQQANASSDLAKQFMDLGKPYRDSLASLEANPSSYYQSPEVQGALQQGSDALARSLSAKVGNPILNPTAMQEMQNYSTNGLLTQLNQRRNFLANAGGLGVGQAAQLGTNAAQSSGGVYNALGAGLGTVFGNQKDYAAELLDILKNRGSSSGMSLV